MPVWPRLSPGHIEELELDVIGIPEDDHRVRQRIAGVDHTGVLDTEAIQPSCPRIEISPASHQKCHMLRPRPPLTEGWARFSVVMMHPEHDARTRLHQNARVAALPPAMMRENHWQPGHPEDPLIPLRACLHIGDGRREVV